MNYVPKKDADTHNTRLAMVAKYTHNAIIITDPMGLVEWVNDGFTRITGFTLDDVKGKKPGSLLQGPESDPKIIHQIRQALKFKKSFDVELINYTKEGYPYWIRIEGVPLRDNEGNLTGFMAIESDVTSRKQYEDMLIRAKQAAEAANQAKIQFLNNISHEFRTPMNGILGLGELLKTTALDNEQTDYVTDILQSSERLLSLIDNLFILTNDDAIDKAELHETVDIKRLISSIVERYGVPAKMKGLDFKYHPSRDIPQYTFGNKSLISQVISNLCDNALKFTEIGSIQLSVELSGSVFDRYMVIKLSDTGVGFDPVQLQELFSPFKQGDASLTRQYEGSGLGLYASRRIAQVIGGDIELVSRKGVGTTAKFWWPI